MFVMLFVNFVVFFDLGHLNIIRANFVGHWPEKPTNFQNVMTSLTTSCTLFFLIPQGTLKMKKNLFIAGCSGIS